MSAIDPFLRVTQSGRIWWRMEDAIKLGAGFQPNPDSSKQGPTLLATSNQQRATERTLLAAVRKQYAHVTAPQTIEREDGVFVSAGDFLVWLGQYLLETESDIPFPSVLARAVSNAESMHAGTEQYQPLLPQIEEWLKEPLAKLPSPLREQVSREIFPFTWEDLAPSQRRKWAEDRDLKRDPALEGMHKFWFDFYCRRRELEEQIATWEKAGARSAAELAAKERKLTRLNGELSELDSKARKLASKERLENERLARLTVCKEIETSNSAVYVPFPKAMKRLRAAYGATVEELAVWVWLGARDGGLTAYIHANEFAEPEVFHFPPGVGKNFDFVSSLMATDYRESDLAAFKPGERFISSKDLLERWQSQSDIVPEAYVRAKIERSELRDLHPIFGYTQWSDPDNKELPPKKSAVFELSRVEAIEQRDFVDSEAGPNQRKGAGAPVPADQIIDHFKVEFNAAKNGVWWRNRMRDVNAYGLSDCRASKGKPGAFNSSTWFPGEIAAWLVDKKHMDSARVANVLRKAFPDCTDIADQLDPSD